MLRTENLGIRFGRFQAVQDVTVRFEGPGVHSVIGPNGAGKTTFFNALSGVLRPSSGRIFTGVREITRCSPAQRLSMGIARSFQITSLFEEETVRENLRIAVQGRRGNRWAFLRGANSDADIANRVNDLIGMFALQKYADTPVRALSHGLKRIIDISLCIAGDADTVLLDEPTSGVGIDDVPRIRSLIENLGRERLVILIEHNMGVVLGISKTVSVLVRGSLLITGAPEEVQRNKDVQAAYLGTGNVTN